MNKARIVKILVAFVIIVVGGSLTAYWLPQRAVSDRQQILDMFLQVEQAVERKSISGVMRHISEDYDDGTYSKRDLNQLAIAAFRERGSFNVLASASSLDISGNQATAQVKVRFWTGYGSAGQAQRLTLWIQAEKKGKRWQVTSAHGWEQAQQAL